jgi:chromosome segregation ATPase
MNSSKSSQLDVVKKLKRAETRLRSLTRDLQSLEARKQGYLQDMVRGGKLLREVKEAEQGITRKHRAISRAKEAVSNLHAQLEGELARFKRDLIAQKQRELDRHMGQRERYLKRIEELEVEISRYRYLLTGKKDRRLAEVKDPLPREVRDRDNFISIDEVIGHISLEIHRIIRMNSKALLKEYMARESGNHPGFTKGCESPS